MDKIDRHILEVLQNEGRISIADLADQVGLSPSPCARRLKRLEEENYIEDYQANLNKNRVGITMTFFVEVSLNRHQEETIEVFESALLDMDEVINAHIVSGRYDYLLEVVSKNLAGYEAFTNKLHRIKSVKDIHTHLAVRKIAAKRALPIYV
tara:strand:- start:14 stop:469 length:456 start_codon:yes stop_codon:yes gene_type:complete